MFFSPPISHIFLMHPVSVCSIENFVAEHSGKVQNCSQCRVWGNAVIFYLLDFLKTQTCLPIKGRGPIFPGLTARYLPPSRLPPEEDELEQSDRFYRSLPRLVKLTFALHQAAVAKSETLCYLVIILNHTLSASILSMVLPILSFLWAMLSVPRPSKRFWMAAIYYTEVGAKGAPWLTQPLPTDGHPTCCHCHHRMCLFLKFECIYLAALSFSCTCGISFPDQGSNPGCLHWEQRVLAIG